jgi:hypothetical protein
MSELSAASISAVHNCIKALAAAPDGLGFAKEAIRS